MALPEINVDTFRMKPVRELVGLLPDLDAALTVCNELDEAGLDPSTSQLLSGDEGARILDSGGTEHGYRARLVRFFQNLGFNQNVLAVYDEGLRRGGALLSIPCSRDEAVRMAGYLARHGGHAMNYYGEETLEHLGPP